MTTDKTPATLAVDVLAAMDQAAEVLLDERRATCANRLEDARAAVAELIEADESLDACKEEIRRVRNGMHRYQPLHPDTPALHRLEDAIKRRATALARVKGESA